MSQNNKDNNIYEEIQNFTTYKNKNNFDDYFSLVLPTLSNLNILILLFDYNIDNVNLIYVSNSPKKKKFYLKRKIREIDKIGYLAHKTEKKNKQKDNNIHKIITIQPSVNNKEFLGKKRETKEISVGVKTVSDKLINNNKILYCLNCAWKFPDRMSYARKNIHINKCFEGKGRIDIMEYNEEQKLKIYRKYPYKKLFELKICPICGKDMTTYIPNEKQIHLNECSRRSIK